jgi:hypothetical protein
MKGSKGYLLAEVLVCLAAAVIICVSAVGAYTSSIKLMVQRNAAAYAFNAAAGAYDETALQKAGFAVEKTEFYCPGLRGPFYYVTVKNSGGKMLASVVTGGE